MRISVSCCRNKAERFWFETRKQKSFASCDLERRKVYSRTMNSVTLHSIMRSLWVVMIGFVLASCGEPERPKPSAAATHPARVHGEFDEVGTVTLYPGESCASQVVFVFHNGPVSTSLAAPWHPSEVLKDAVRSHRRVRVVGKWRRGKTADCTYVEATQVESIQKSFW